MTPVQAAIGVRQVGYSISKSLNISSRKNLFFSKTRSLESFYKIINHLEMLLYVCIWKAASICLYMKSSLYMFPLYDDNNTCRMEMIDCFI